MAESSGVAAVETTSPVRVESNVLGVTVVASTSVDAAIATRVGKGSIRVSPLGRGECSAPEDWRVGGHRQALTPRGLAPVAAVPSLYVGCVHKTTVPPRR